MSGGRSEWLGGGGGWGWRCGAVFGRGFDWSTVWCSAACVPRICVVGLYACRRPPQHSTNTDLNGLTLHYNITNTTNRLDKERRKDKYREEGKAAKRAAAAAEAGPAAKKMRRKK